MPEKQAQTQVAVIGGGPGGYAAAFQAAELGLKATVVTTDATLGGVCLLRGCIPSKALLHAAKLLNEARESVELGIHFGEPRVDLNALRAWKNSVIHRMVGGLGELGRHRKVEVIHARAEFVDSRSLRLHALESASPAPPELLRFEHAVVATGSSPARPGPLKVEDPHIMDSTSALDLADIPGSLLVVGGGYIGLEMGTVYAALGSKVTVVEMTPDLLPGCDRDLVRPLQARLEKSFAAIHLETKVEGLQPGKDGVKALFKGAKAPAGQVFDRVLIAVGRTPNSRGLGLENTKAKVNERGFIEVDAQRRTADAAIFAIGDVAGEPMLAHKATREAKVAADSIAGHKTAFDNVAIPAVVFTDPEIAWCGLTETQARAQGRKVQVSRFPWAASGRAVSLARPEGSTKIVFDPETERVLGVGIVGAGAGELIAEGVLAVEMGAVADDLAGSIHAHPTLGETLMESAEAFLGQATHLYRPKRQ